MKKIEIKSEKQDNGIWGTPLNCTYMSNVPPIHDSRKYLLFSAILIAFAEQYIDATFRLDIMTDSGFALYITDSIKNYNKNNFYMEFFLKQVFDPFFIRYENCEVLGNMIMRKNI